MAAIELFSKVELCFLFLKLELGIKALLRSTGVKCNHGFFHYQSKLYFIVSLTSHRKQPKHHLESAKHRATRLLEAFPTLNKEQIAAYKSLPPGASVFLV